MPGLPTEKSTLSAAALTAMLAVATLVLGACGDDTKRLTAAELKDPNTCQTCHPAQVAEWSRSMHAYASDDPVFTAMNQRGQRETAGALGDFCVKCHAPIALHDGATTDGLNLASLPAAERGVTCYFCHSVESVDGTHNNPLTLASDGRLVGPIADPVGGAPHASAYSAFLDGAQAESAAACGSCHDIVNQHSAALERTYQEWQVSQFSMMPHGQSCAQCHMDGADGPASTTSTKSRHLHAHDFPAVDIPISAFPGADPGASKQAAQARLDTVVQSTICVDDAARKVLVALDNVAAGHNWPSGAAQDRRAWIDVTAYLGDQVVYQSGVAAGETVEQAADPDLWVMRDCIYDENQVEAQMFWQAASLTSNSLPGSVIATVADQTSFTKSHLMRAYPVSAALTSAPDRVTVQVYLKAIGDDVLDSLVASKDLDPALAAAVPQYQLGGSATLEWTRAKATPYLDSTNKDQVLCLTLSRYTPIETIAPAVSHARCTSP